ncbi:MAG: type II secretion system F family protein [Planctomycetota bacterium]|nr:type II secretion system F family protein [Planctomycetota bacterium]
MPIFEWKGYDAKGKTATGVVDADSPREARLKLKKEKVLVTQVGMARGGVRAKAKAKTSDSPGLLAKFGFGERISKKIEAARGRDGGNRTKKRIDEVGTFTRQLATLTKAGIPITEALRAIIEQVEGKRLGVLYRDIREQISQGLPTADALARHPDYFDELYVSMVRSGEAAGRLDEVLDRLAIFMQEQARLRNKVQAAMAYPMIMLLVGLLVVSVLMVTVVPKITNMLQARGQELPLPTQFLQNASDFLLAWWWVLILVAILSVLAFNLYYSSDKGRLNIDSKMLKVPVFGDLITKQALSRFAQTFATLLQSGVPVVRCLEVTRTVLGNKLLEDTIDGVREKILEGADIASPIKASGVFPPLVGYMIAVGEQSGELDSMMLQVGEAYQEEVEIATTKFTSLIEPLLILFLAGVVGFIVASILMPIMKMSESFG